MPDNRPMLSDRAIQIVAENKIRAAIVAGEFDNLPGFGQKAAILDEPYDPFWWIRRKLKREALQHLIRRDSWSREKSQEVTKRHVG